MLRDRKELDEVLISTIKNKRLKTKRNVVNSIINQLRNNNIIQAMDWINQPDKFIPELDDRELFLLTEQVFEQTEVEAIKPDLWFTPVEVKLSKQFSGTVGNEDSEKLPITLEGFIKLNHNTYLGKISGNKLARMTSASLITYNFDIQREHGYTKNKSKKPKLVMQNVLEIEENLRKGTQKHTQIVINASLGSAEGNEDEIIYDPEAMRLTITRGTVLDIVDGYHRTKATEMVYLEDGNVNFDWILLLTNYTDDDAKIYQGQLAKATPIAKERREMLLMERKADLVLQDLIPKSELNERVSGSRFVHTVSKEVVAYSVLAKAIDSHFRFEKMVDVYKVSAYLVKFFNILMGTYENEFLNNPQEYRNKSLINNNNFFVGYIVLAKRLYERNLDPSEIIGIMEKIDFSKDNPLWAELGIINNKGNITDTPKARKAIESYFENIEI